MSSKPYTGRPSGMFVFLILLVCALSAVAVVWMIQAMVIPQQGMPETTPPATQTTAAPEDTTNAPGTTVATAAPETTAPVVPHDTDTTLAPETTEAPVTTAPLPPVITLPKADAPVGDDYFSSILFIGDSRSQGLSIATGGYGATFYADRGLSIDGVSSKKFLVQKQPDGSNASVSVIEALTASPHKGRIYIWLGINELGYATSRFESSFRTQLSAIRTACPDAEIVIMSLLPVGRNASVYGIPSNADANAKVSEYNSVLLRLAEEVGVYYLNCYESFADAEGYLPDGYASDGIHLVRDQNLAICDYIRNHPVPSADIHYHTDADTRYYTTP